MWNKVATAIASLIIDKLIRAVMAWLTQWNEERKTNVEIKKEVKVLRESKTEEEIRSAVRNLNL